VRSGERREGCLMAPADCATTAPLSSLLLAREKVPPFVVFTVFVWAGRLHFPRSSRFLGRIWTSSEEERP
jgi:hypothetical protein